MDKTLNQSELSTTEAIWTLISQADVKVQQELYVRLRNSQSKHHVEKKEPTKQHSWLDYPISDKVMSMTFQKRKDLPADYKKALEEELKKKYK